MTKSIKQIIAFTGFQGSGKTYACNRLVAEQDFIKLSFANSLRKMAFKTLNIRYAEGMNSYTELKSTNIYNNQNFRNILENLGSAIRVYDKDFFARALTKEIDNIKNKHSICIDDMRYTNEYLVLLDYCKQNNISFYAVFCDYNSDRYDENNMHESTKLSRYLKQIGYKNQQIVQDYDIRVFDTTLNNKIDTLNY